MSTARKVRKSRAYLVEIIAQHGNGLVEPPGPRKFLVRAPSAPAAKRLVEPVIAVRIASKDDLVEAIQTGLVLIDGDAQTVLGQHVLGFGSDPGGAPEPPLGGQTAAQANGHAESPDPDLPAF